MEAWVQEKKFLGFVLLSPMLINELHLGQGAMSWLHHLYSLALFFGQCA